MSEYTLYYTLNKDLKSKKLTQKQKQSFLKFAKSKELSEEKKKALVLLIAEHSRIEENHQFDSKNMILPYGMKEEPRGVVIDLSKIPDDLLTILYKFSSMSTS